MSNLNDDDVRIEDNIPEDDDLNIPEDDDLNILEDDDDNVLGGDDDNVLGDDDDNVLGDDEQVSPPDVDNEPLQAEYIIKKKPKQRSPVWDHMKLVDCPGAVQKYQCLWCKSLFTKQGKGSTTHLLRHLKEHCSFRDQIFRGKVGNANEKDGVAKMIQSQLHASILPEGESSLKTFSFDFARVKLLDAHMILAHEYPFSIVEHKVFNEFLRAYSPYYKKISSYVVRLECLDVFHKEKEKIKNLLAKVDRIGLTTDCWTSDSQKIGYMVVTGHFIDNDWNLQKRVLAFVHVPPPHNGVTLALQVHKVCKDYGISQKVASVTVDNASANDSCIDILKSDYDLISNLVLDGKLFHVRCCAHIINLLVKDGLKEIDNVTEIVRDGIKYLFASEARLSGFNEQRINLMLPTNKLVLDNNTRWNSTFVMLKTAYTYRKCFSKFGEVDQNFKKYVPSDLNWEEVHEVCDFLEVFYDVTNLISGSNYPTVNLFLLELSRIKVLINEQLDPTKKKHMVFMALRMGDKFDKYWGHCNLLLSFGSILDPRYKMGMITFAFNDMFGDESEENVKFVEDKLEELYDQYATLFGDEKGNGDALRYGTVKQPPSSTVGKRKFDEFMTQQQVKVNSKNDLQLYLEEPCHPNDVNLNVLHYWKVNEGKYKVLSKMAKDILSIPVTTVASESTFSAGGRVISKRRASMRVDTIEALLCGGDWIKEAYGIRSNKPIEEQDELKFHHEFAMMDNKNKAKDKQVQVQPCPTKDVRQPSKKINSQTKLQSKKVQAQPKKAKIRKT